MFSQQITKHRLKFAVVGVASLMFSSAVQAGVVFHTTSSAFNSATSGFTFMGSENWSSGVGSDGSVNDPMQPGVAKPPHFPSGTSVASGITVQSNTLANPTTLSPRGTNGLYYGPTGYAGVSGNLQPSNQLSTGNQLDSFDILFSTVGANYPKAVDLSPMYYQVAGGNTGTLTIRVYDTANSLLGSTTVANVPDVLETGYIGIVMTGSSILGRVNVDTPNTDIPGADNIRVFGSPIPEPTSVGLLAGVGLIALRRRN